MRLGIISLIGLAFHIICFLICRLVLFLTSKTPDPVFRLADNRSTPWSELFTLLKDRPACGFHSFFFLQEAGLFSLGSSTANNSISLLLDSSFTKRALFTVLAQQSIEQYSKKPFYCTLLPFVHSLSRCCVLVSLIMRLNS